MNKLETITELLVNELTDFNSDVAKLDRTLERLENLRVKLELEPLKNLMSQLKDFQQNESQARNAFENRLSRKLEDAKIYPKWAVITFIISLLMTFSALFFGYYQMQYANFLEQQAYEKGKLEATDYINIYFAENPKALENFKNWSDAK